MSHNPPRQYDLDSPDDLDRLLRETLAYARVSLHHGTDTEGRRFAYDALRTLIANGYELAAGDRNAR